MRVAALSLPSLLGFSAPRWLLPARRWARLFSDLCAPRSSPACDGPLAPLLSLVVHPSAHEKQTSAQSRPVARVFFRPVRVSSWRVHSHLTARRFRFCLAPLFPRRPPFCRTVACPHPSAPLHLRLNCHCTCSARISHLCSSSLPQPVTRSHGEWATAATERAQRSGLARRNGCVSPVMCRQCERNRAACTTCAAARGQVCTAV